MESQQAEVRFIRSISIGLEGNLFRYQQLLQYEFLREKSGIQSSRCQQSADVKQADAMKSSSTSGWKMEAARIRYLFQRRYVLY